MPLEPIAPTPRNMSAMTCRELDIEKDFLTFEEGDEVGEAEGEHECVADEGIREVTSAETERLKRHEKRLCVGEWREVDDCEGLRVEGIAVDAATDTGSGDCGTLETLFVADDNVSVGVGGTNEIRGEGDWEPRRPEREGSVDRRLGDGARGGSSFSVKSVVDSESLGRLRDEEDAQGGGSRNCRLLECAPGKSPEQVEGVGLVARL